MAENDLYSVLSSHGIRPTQQRISVYKYLLSHPVHPSADTIYRALSQEFPVFSRTTIYNTLNSLEKSGLVRSINIQHDEQRFDTTTEDHGHFLCIECNEITDFDITRGVLITLCPQGYENIRGDVFITGFCPKCKEKR
ncbi:MAG: Fur family transcriptional regulator [Oscillospiraceae bacterium]|nr:Fur family transcriptional regulator [Oscillospiraceae bacterium]MDD3832415.1 Fur family transcriptional regulator [Oscillospiraceae bacterium]MDD4545870.1 Fur family transcriptional regulator [Oscillospiraceae bacterium]